jgi:cytoskeletal protein RodZ
MTPLYSLTTPGNQTIEISQDELRSLLGRIETELHRSKVYRRALATIQKMLGDSAEDAKLLFKAVGREAIGLAFRQFSQQQTEDHKITPELNQPTEELSPTNSTASSAIVQTSTSDMTETLTETSSDLSACLTSVKPHPDSIIANPGEINLNLETPRVDNHSKKVTEKDVITNPLSWLKQKKPSQAEIKQQLTQKRSESLQEIGKQLRTARELRGLSLTELNNYTHVQTHLMEAIENGKWDELPEDVYVRGFIRVMANALGLNGTNLAASLPQPEPVKAVLPSWYEAGKKSSNFDFQVNPMHLYLGYTALVAGAVGGLSLISHQANSTQFANPNSKTSSSVSDSHRHQEPNNKPGLQSNSQGVKVGNDIAPPENL